MRPFVRVTYILALSVFIGMPMSSIAKDKKEKPTGLEGLKMKAGDEANNDVRALKTELMIASSEKKAVKQAQRLIRKYRGTRLEPDLQLRLAELYMRRAKTDRFLKLQRKSDTVVKLAPKMIRSAKPKKHVLKAVKIFDKIERKWPRFEKMDEVLFNNAFAHQQLGRKTKAERLFNKMIKTYSRSPLIADAHLAVGEMAFQRKQFKKALGHFNAIRQYPDSMVYPYGLYKGAWSMYNLRDASGGLKSLEEVIQYGRFVRDQGIDSRLDLRKEALQDMALFFEDVYPAKKAFSYFEKQADELDVAPVILKLSNLYKRHSRHKDNAIILSDFIRKRSTSDYVPTAYVELMDSNEKMNKQEVVVSLLTDMSETCHAESKWAKAQIPNILTAKDSPLYELNEEKAKVITGTQVCTTVFRKKARYYANRWLKIWKKDQSKTRYADVTEKAFQVYLAQDPKTEKSAKTRFVYAELLFKRNKFRQASENYEIAGTHTKTKTLGHDSRYFALIALEKAVKDKWSDKDEKRFQELAKTYLTKNKKPKYALDIKFKVALIAYQKERYDEAGPQLLAIGDKYPRRSKGLKAQDLYLDILNIQKKYAELKDYSNRLRKITRNKTRKKKMNKIYEESYFLLVQKQEEDGKYEEAIKGYKAFAKTNPRSKLAKEALWNAMQLHFKNDDLSGGADSAVHYASKYSLDKKSIDALMKAAQTYESMGQLSDAANVLLKLASLDAKSKARWWLLAADFYKLSGNFKRAKPLYVKIRRHGDKEQNYRALKQLESIADVTGKKKDREKWLKVIVSKGRQPEASMAELYFLEKIFAKKNYSKAFIEAKKLVGNRSAAPTARAKARLIQARILADEFKRQSVKTSLERLNLVLQIKTEKLGKAQVAYQSAAKYGDPKVAVIALKELGDIYMQYNKDLRNMPIPRGVPEAEVPIFRTEMNKLAIPMEEKAYETKLAAYKQAQAFNLRDGVLRDLQAELDKMNHQVGTQPLITLEFPAVVVPKQGGV